MKSTIQNIILKGDKDLYHEIQRIHITLRGNKDTPMEVHQYNYFKISLVPLSTCDPVRTETKQRGGVSLKTLSTYGERVSPHYL